jgi:hypothetical protein
MVRRPGRSLIAWLLAVMIGGLSMFGEELHELLGLHHHQPFASLCSSEVSGFFHGNSFENGHICLVAAANNLESCHNSATCPICQYLAQGRVVGQRVAVVSVAVSIPNRSPAVSFFLPSPHLQPFQARAPPAA